MTFALLSNMSNHRLPKMSILYLLLSAASGVGWAVISFIIFGNSRSQSPSIGMLLLMGASTGLMVGFAMYWFYRTSHWVHTIYSAPLALWLGVFFYFSQTGLYNTQNAMAIFSAAWYACIMFFTPFVALLWLALVNGILLRWTLRRSLENQQTLN